MQEDLEALAPKVPAHVRAEVEEKDPTLDQDIADWFSPNCDRPRLSLLGPVTARTHGKALAKRKPYFTELLAFLALHRKHGATREADPRGVRHLRRQGARLHQHRPRLARHQPPHRRAPPALRRQGPGRQGSTGSTSTRSTTACSSTSTSSSDSASAGRPAAAPRASPTCALPSSSSAGAAVQPTCARTDGPGSPTNVTAFDLMAPGWIADVALIVVTEALATGDLVKARSAAYVANRADPDGESTRLCLAHVTKAEGDQLEAERILREEICNRSDDGDAPMELSERTKTIISTHGWLAS